MKIKVKDDGVKYKVTLDQKELNLLSALMSDVGFGENDVEICNTFKLNLKALRNVAGDLSAYSTDDISLLIRVDD